VTRFDAATLCLVDLWTAAHAPAHKLHKAKISKQKRTNDVLPKPDNFKSYRHSRAAASERRRASAARRVATGNAPARDAI
jgi:hypothetical protein